MTDTIDTSVPIPVPPADNLGTYGIPDVMRAHYLPLTTGQEDLSRSCKSHMNELHDWVTNNVPHCRERSLALTKLEEASMWAVKALTATPQGNTS